MRRCASYILLALAVPAVVIILYQTIKLGVLGDYGFGHAAAAEIPYVGGRFKNLVAKGPVAYSYKCSPHGGGVVSISGAASRDAIDTFCDTIGTSLSMRGTNIQDRNEIVQFLRDHFDVTHAVHEWNGGVSDSTMVLFCFGGGFHKLYGVWESDTERFAIWLQFVE